MSLTDIMHNRIPRRSKPEIRGADTYALLQREKQNQRESRTKAAKNLYTLEIVKDHDGSYYVNLHIGGELATGLPDYVPYREIKTALKKKYGIEIPKLKDLELRQFGRKWFATLEGELK